jgi:hypothetical protein
MEAAFEVVQLVVHSGFQALTLALAYASWRASRPEQPRVTIERGGIKIITLGLRCQTPQIKTPGKKRSLNLLNVVLNHANRA